MKKSVFSLFLAIFSLVFFGSTAIAGSSFERTADGSKTVVKFSFGSAILMSASYNVMAGAIQFINDNISQISGPIRVDGYADPIGEAPYNQILSERRANAVVRYMKANGVQTDNFAVTGYGETTSFGSNADNRRVEVSVTLGANTIVDDSSLQNSEISEVDPSAVGAAASTAAIVTGAAAFDKHKFGLSVAALHTELASENASGSTDEVLSEVRAAAELSYSYFIKPSFYLKALAGVRWYEYEQNTAIFINDDQTNWAYRFGAGLGFMPKNWWDINVTGTYDSQLYYFADAPAGIPEITFDLEGGVRADVMNTIRFINTNRFDFKIGLGGGYLFGADEIDSGFSYSVRPSVGILMKKALDLYALYQVNEFEVSSTDVKHEILELGVSLDF